MEASAIGSIIPIFLAQLQLVIISCLQEDAGKAKRYCAEIWGLIQDTGAALAAVMGLAAFGIAAARFEEKPVRGVRLLAAALTQMAQRGLNFASNTDDPLARVFMQSLETARSRLGPAAFDGAWAEGQRMTLEQALALATEIQN